MRTIKTSVLALSVAMLGLASVSGCAPTTLVNGVAEAPAPLSAATLAHIEESKRLTENSRVPASFLASLYNTVRRSDLIDQNLLPPPNANFGNIDARPAFEPTRIFDNAYYFGNDNYGALVLVTSDGIIQFDAMGSDDEARDKVLAGYEEFGLDPAQIKYLIITHGHGDHYGGVNYFKSLNPNITVLASDADWDLMEAEGNRSDLRFTPPPQRGSIVTDGQQLTLGNTTITLYVTPGHTPGTVSAIIPVTHQGTPHMMGLFGGMGMPLHLEPNERSAGLDEYIRQWQRFGNLARAAGVEGALATHAGHDGTYEYVPALRSLPAGSNPWLLGASDYATYLRVNEEVSLAIKGAIEDRGMR